MSASPRFRATLPGSAADLIPDDAARSLVASADRLLLGEWQVLGIARKDVAAPDWFFDPITGRRAPQDDYCFSVDHRSESVTGNVKQVWELSRLQHVTVLAAAYAASGSDVYAEAAARSSRPGGTRTPSSPGSTGPAVSRSASGSSRGSGRGGSSRDGRARPLFSRTTRRLWRRSGGTSVTWLHFGAVARRPTTT